MPASATYRAAGLQLVKFGEEAIVDLSDYTLVVPQRANLRREVGRARRAGLSAAVLPWATAKPLLQLDMPELISGAHPPENSTFVGIG